MPLFVRGSLVAVARTSMAHPEHRMRVSLYPMFHIGSPAFYQAISDDLTRFRVFLLEGVRSRGFRGPLYDLAARNLRLVTQRNHLTLPPGAERLPLDMTGDEFEREVKAVPLHWRLALWLLRPILWALTSTAAGRHAAWDSFSERTHRATRDERDTPLDELILTKRDRAMSDRLRAFVEDPRRQAAAEPVAVIAGAAHMPALYATLRACGFRKGTQRWFEVLEGVVVPSRSTDGRPPSPTP